MGCIDWLQDAGLINVCHCMSFLELPIRGNADDSKFKVCFSDTGLLVASLDDESQEDLRANKNLGVYKGVLHENFAAEALVKQGYELCYYKKENATLEEVFFSRSRNELIPVEIKGNINKSKALNQLISGKQYEDISHGIKFTTGNIGHNDPLYTFPYFCLFLLKRFMKDQIFLLSKTQKNWHPQTARESGFFVFFAPRRLFCAKNQYFGKYEVLKH